MPVTARLLLPHDVPKLFVPSEGVDDADARAVDSIDVDKSVAERRFRFVASWQESLSSDDALPAAIDVDGVLAGAALCRVRDDRLWLTGSLLPPYRGRRLAFPALSAVLALMTVRPLHVRARPTATAAQATLTRAGFRKVGVDDDDRDVYRLDFVAR